ncbi:MAG: hypothetical protein CYG61_02675 [Actinobacteria bacterium]|nr:MAG: hypothetical protein CYG61_02675 [Actinomycetota bacterium]
MTASLRRWSALLVGPVLAVVVTAGCSGGGDDAEKKAVAPDAGEPAAAFAFTVTGADVQSAAPQPPPFPEDVKAAVKASLDTYLVNGVAAPLQTGKPPGGLEGVFTGAAGARLAGGQPDRLALLEEGQPVSGKVTQDRADARLTALTDPAGAVAVVVSQLDFALTVKGKGTTLTVARTGEMALVFDNNAWRIDSFDLRTARDTR